DVGGLTGVVAAEKRGGEDGKAAQPEADGAEMYGVDGNHERGRVLSAGMAGQARRDQHGGPGQTEDDGRPRTAGVTGSCQNDEQRA
ncbi:MAG: hypothetical protein C4345_08055, partial [Chloroflexota bacterium]